MFNTAKNLDYNNIELFDVFRSIYNKIKSKFSILNNNNCESEDIIELYSSDAVYHHSKYILKSLDNLLNLLDDSKFEDEYYDCFFIKDMANYIFDDETLLVKHIDFIENIIISFCNLLDDKLDTLLNSKTIEYDRVYKDFTEFFSQQKMIFYTEICSGDVEDEELIYNVINTLGWIPIWKTYFLIPTL